MHQNYEAIFSGQTSPTQKLAQGKAAWITSLSLDEKEIETEEADKAAKFTAACVRLASAADEIDLYITDDLNRFNYQVLQKDEQKALALAKAGGEKWKEKKTNDLKQVTNLKNTFSWNNIFDGVDKELLLKIIEARYQTDSTFLHLVDGTVSQRITYIKNLSLKDKSLNLVPAQEILKKFTNYVKEECAGVLALRLKGYTDAFYLAKLNQATAMIATAQFDLLEGDENTEINHILSKINETPLTFRTPSQYKLLDKPSKNPSPLGPSSHANGVKDRTALTPQYQLYRNVGSIDIVDSYWRNLFAELFNSKTMTFEEKLKVISETQQMAALSTSSPALRTANSSDFVAIPSMRTSDLPRTFKQGGEASVPIANYSPAVEF